MGLSIVYTIDDVNYKGGAHVATLSQIEYISRNLGASVTVLTLAEPSEELRREYDMITFVSTGAEKVTTDPKLRKKQIRKLLRHVKQQDTVCVPFENSLFRQQAAKLNCRKKIQWIHIDYAVWRLVNEPTRLYTAHDEEIYSRFDQLVFVSEKGRRGFLELYPQFHEKCAVCRNLFDTENILQKSLEPHLPGQIRFSEAPGVFKIVTAARLNNIHKGITRCLLVADLLKAKGYRFEWMFIGSGEPEEEALFHQITKDFDLNDCILWAGHQKNPFSLIQKADIFALFSFYEGIANTIYEALICGTPVIATDVSGVREQISEGMGWIVENDMDSMAAGLEYLLENRPELAKAQECLRTYQYDASTIQSRVEKIFMSADAITEPMLERSPAVSVIVPVYNVENYLDQCLDSLVRQTLENIEILAVNDGSPDSSAEIIDDYVKRYPGKVRRLDKENGGLGDARNFGLRHARGSYVAFIDGDDWVAPDMMEEMYKAGVKENCDIVLADLYGYHNVEKTLTEEHAPFPAEGVVQHNQLVMYSTRPVVVSACTKLYRRELFNTRQFPKGWYEDMGLIPILYTYANSVYYIPKCFYYYRWEREGSIQSQKTSQRTLDIFKSKQRLLEESNPEYQTETAFAVYDHCCRFYDSQPQFTKETLEFVNQNRHYFVNNLLIQKQIKEGERPCLWSDEPLIPKVIHYCWFGGKEKPKSVMQCIESWKKYLPDYDIREWNENNCDLEENEYVKSAYRLKKWAYVADYVRFKVLYECGGLYMDTDMLVKANLDHLLFYEAVFPWETYLFVNGCIMAATPENKLIGRMLGSYQKDTFSDQNIYTICHRMTDILLAHYQLSRGGEYQILPERTAIFPANMLVVDVSDGACLTEHLYDASWMDKGVPGASYKYDVLRDFFLYPAVRAYAKKQNPNLSAAQGGEGNRYEVVDGAIQKYGVKFVTRQLIKAVLRFVLPAGLYQKIEDRALA